MLKQLMIKSSLVAMAVFLSASAYAVAEGLPRALPPQPLTNALEAFAQMSGLQVIYRAELAAGLNSKGAREGQSPEEALRDLLRDTGLTYSFVNDRMVAIRGPSGGKAPDRRPSAPAAGLHQGRTEATSNSFWSRFRLAQVNQSAASTHSPAETSRESGPDGGTLEEIVVTAQKRQESLQDVPISISVLSGAGLDKSTLQGVTEALNRVPGVATNVSPQGGGTLVTVRGVTAGDPLFSGSNPVAYYLDTVPFGLVDSSIAPDTNAFDLERIEVLRGPQGTLYGASALNGVVRVLTHDADLDRFEIKARASVSSTQKADENYRGDLALNMPLIADKLAARAVLGYQDFSGWINKANKRNANDSQLTNARLKINARLNDRLSIGASTWISRQDYGAPSIANDQGETLHVEDESSSINYNSHGLKIEYDFPAFSLSSMTGYIDYKNRGRLDYIDFITVPTLLIQNMDASVFSQEINLASAREGSWRWTAGAIYRDGSTDTIQIFPSFGNFTFDWTTSSRSYAVFAELTRLFWDGRLEATLGGRYFEDEVLVKEGNSVAPYVAPNYYREKETFTSTTPRVVVSWHPEKTVTIYGSYSEGFRSGAPQAYYARPPGVAQPGPRTEPDELRNYELGAKADLLENRLSFDASVYYMEWEGVHQALSIEVDGFCCAGSLVNGPSASGLGVDLGLTARPTVRMELGVSLSWNDLTFDEVVEDATGVVKFPKGARLNFSPERTIGGFANYFFPMGTNGFRGRIAASANYRSEIYWRSAGIDPSPTDSSLVTAASFSIEAPQNWIVTLFGDNLTNEDGRIYTNTGDILNPANSGTTARTRPRTIGLQFEYRF